MPSEAAVKLVRMRCRSTGIGQRLDVLGLDVGPAVEQGPGLAAEDQVLHGTRAGAPRQPVADELRHARLADARLPHQGQRVAG